MGHGLETEFWLTVGLENAKISDQLCVYEKYFIFSIQDEEAQFFYTKHYIII